MQGQTVSFAPDRPLAPSHDAIGTSRVVAAMRELRSQPDSEPTFGPILTLAQNGPAMYPVLAATTKGLVAAWTTGGEQSRVFVRSIAP